MLGTQGILTFNFPLVFSLTLSCSTIHLLLSELPLTSLVSESAMDFITPVFEICITCWDRSAKYRLPIKAFRKSLKDLSAERERLVDVRNDVKRRVDREKLEMHQLPTNEVSGWSNKVEDICNEVDGILQRGEEAALKNCLGGHCPTNSRFRYKLAKEADEVKASVKELLDIGRNFKDAQVTFKPAESSSTVGHQEPTVGMDEMFDTVRKWVEDETVRSIGLFGVGGVGKTTLLKRVYNHFVRVNSNKHFVLWVVVSQPVSIEKIQKKIWGQLKFSDADWEATEKEERPIKMQNFLYENNFMLFLDDLWKKIDLAEVGIPHPQSNSNVIFSTRSEEVCGHMQASTSVEANRRMKVVCLAPKEALQLFREKVGEETWTANPQIPKLAEIVVKECQYLPLALTTVARAMVFKKEPRQWNVAIKDLRSNMAKFQGMQEKVLKILKFSFDALPDETHKKCFLYCSLFPEDFLMGKYDLMDLWIGEGYFDEFDNTHDARYCCEDVLGKLTTTCLLDECPYDINLDVGKGASFEFYKMHDLVREMALWVARELHEKKILLLEDERTIGLHELKRWKDAEMISLMHEGCSDDIFDATIQNELPKQLPYCMNLSTLIFRKTIIESFPGGFFSSMPSLKVLDLSENRLLCELPRDIGELANLQYLNIQLTNIRELPVEFKKLIKLKYLFLDSEVDIDCVPETIPCLRVFDNFFGQSIVKHRQNLLKLLQGVDVENSAVSLTLNLASEIQQLWTCPRLQSCLRYLRLRRCGDLTSISLANSLVKRMKQFELLFLEDCPYLEEISICSKNGKEQENEEKGLEPSILRFPIYDCFHSLCRVFLFDCPEILHLTSLIYYAPNLDSLFVSRCKNMTEVVRKGDVPEESQDVHILSCLRVLVLHNLPSLMSICWSPLPFPSLRWMYFYECDILCKLPFSVDGNQFNKLQKIEGEEEWWNGLEWDDDTTRQLLDPKFVPLSF